MSCLCFCVPVFELLYCLFMTLLKNPLKMAGLDDEVTIRIILQSQPALLKGHPIV